jgi:hypothetical protein
MPLEIELRFNVNALYSCQVIPGYYATFTGEANPAALGVTVDLP